jgi:hypothetical protein
LSTPTASFGVTRGLLVAGLTEARDSGELTSDTAVQQLADSLLVLIEGLHVIVKGTGDRRLAESAIDAALQAL